MAAATTWSPPPASTGCSTAPVEALSGGQRQRVLLALALAGAPPLLLLDEPTSAMDVEGRRAFWTTMRGLAGRGHTVVFATHHLDEADAVADRVVVVAGGRVVADGSAAQVKAGVAGRTISLHRRTGPRASTGCPAVTAVGRHGDPVTLTTTDAEATLRALLADGGSLPDLEVRGASLEQAVLSLTDRDRSHPMTPLLVFQLRRVGAATGSTCSSPCCCRRCSPSSSPRSSAGRPPTPAEYQDVAGAYMVSMMAYGAIGAALGATIRISFDRASGWLRQLRVTPVPQTQVVRRRRRRRGAAGAAQPGRRRAGRPVRQRRPARRSAPGSRWSACCGPARSPSSRSACCSGCRLDEKAAGGAIGFVGVVLAALGGLWVPVEVFPEAMRPLAHAMPSYWYAELGRDVAAGSAPVGRRRCWRWPASPRSSPSSRWSSARRRPLYAVAG